MVNTNPLIEYDPRLFLFRTLSELAEQENVPIERIDAINRQIVAIMKQNAQLWSRLTSLSYPNYETVARDVVLRLSLGLEHGSKTRSHSSETSAGQ